MQGFWKRLSSDQLFRIACTVLLLGVLGVRLFRLSFPSTFFFDEVYHAFTAETYLHNDPRGYEYWQTPPQGVAYEWTHPPLAKLMMAGTMAVFGENGFGWRLSSALMGTGVIGLTGVLVWLLFKSKRAVLFTMGILSLDNLLLTMSRIAMNDMHFLFFGLLALIAYIKLKPFIFSHKLNKSFIGWLLLTCVALGLSLASKWTALYIGAGMGVDFVLTLIACRQFPRLRSLLSLIFAGALIIPIIYLASYGQFFLQGHTMAQLKDTTEQMWWYHTHLKATHPYESRPWQWILDLRPVWMHVDYSKNAQGLIANIYNTDNPFILWIGLAVAIVTLAFSILTFLPVHIRSSVGRLFPKRDEPARRFLLLMYFILWLPWIASPRIMFFYHYAPAIPFLGALLGTFLARLSRQGQLGRVLTGAVFVISLAGFAILFPLSNGLFMPRTYTDTLFSLFPTWR